MMTTWWHNNNHFNNHEDNKDNVNAMNVCYNKNDTEIGDDVMMVVAVKCAEVIWLK